MKTIDELEKELLELREELREAEFRYHHHLVLGNRDEAGMVTRIKLKSEYEAIKGSVKRLEVAINNRRTSSDEQDYGLSESLFVFILVTLALFVIKMLIKSY